MKAFKTKLAAFSAIVAIAAFAIASRDMSSEKKQAQTITMNDTDGFALMELFTSQGCSSCPPADNLLGQYAAKNDDKIIALAFHVDYWNRLGWTDSFSTSKYSMRQNEYAGIMRGSSVYTPQLIVNGTREFVGSDNGQIASAVATALTQKPVLSISISKTETTGKNIIVNFDLDKSQENTIFHAALVQKQVFTNILRGENRGLKLINYNVVRDFTSTEGNIKSGSAKLQIPAGYSEKDFSIVLYVQDDTSGKILGAAKKSF